MRSLLRSFAFLVAMVTAMTPEQAQFSSPNQTPAQVEEAMRAQASSTNIQAWLESKDPRLIAWGAYFARENNDSAALKIAVKLVKDSLYQGGPDLL